MTRTEPQPRGRRARMARRLLMLALPAALAVGCGGDDDGPANTPVPTLTSTAAPTQTATAVHTATATPTAVNTATATAANTSTATATAIPTSTATAPSTPTPTAPNGDALAACAKLAACDQCFSNSFGQCLPAEACAERLSTDSAVCVNGVAGCGADALGACLFVGCDGGDPGAECE